MGATTYYDIDTFYWPIQVDTGDAVVFSEDGVLATATLDATSTLTDGYQYYAVEGSDQVISTAKGGWGVESIYDEIVAKMTAASPNGLTYTYSSAVSEEYVSGGFNFAVSGYGNGIRIEAEFGSGYDIRLRFDQTAFSDYLKPLFGALETRTTQTAIWGTSGTTAEYTGDYTRGGCWISPVVAYDKRSKDQAQPFRSSQNPLQAYTNSWQAFKTRDFMYRDVGAGHVWPDDRVGSSTLADTWGLAVSDANNALYDLWTHARRGENILWTQWGGDGFSQFELDFTRFELGLCRMSNLNQMSNFRTCLTDYQTPRETYEVNMEFAFWYEDDYEANFAGANTIWKH